MARTNHLAPVLPSLLAVALAALLAPAPAPAQAQAPRLELEGTIGCAFCDGPEMFGSVQAVALSDDGTIIVADAEAPMVRLFAPDGRSLGTLGREGDGPGELRLPLGVFPLPDGGLVVVDLRQKRVTRFDAAHEVETTASFNAFPAGAGYAAGPDRLLVTTTDFRAGLALLHLDAAGGLDTVLAEVPFLDGSGMRFIAPAVRDDGGFAFGDGGEQYRIAVYGPDSDLEARVGRDVERRPRTPEEMEAMRSRLMTSAGARARAEGGPAREREVDPLQPHFYNLTALRFDDADRLWVRTSRARPGRTTFDVFGPDGSFLGEATVEADVGVYAVRAGRLVGLVRDETEVESIGVWRLRE